MLVFGHAARAGHKRKLGYRTFTANKWLIPHMCWCTSRKHEVAIAGALTNRLSIVQSRPKARASNMWADKTAIYSLSFYWTRRVASLESFWNLAFDLNLRSSILICIPMGFSQKGKLRYYKGSVIHDANSRLGFKIEDRVGFNYELVLIQVNWLILGEQET